MNIKLSIITVNLNNKIGLEKTIKSVKEQICENVQYILIDGGSTDGSLETIKEHEGCISWWVSESDSGIYNAMNKGIKVANGEYCLFLNSGDIFFGADVIMDLLAALNSSSDIYYSDALILDEKQHLSTIQYPVTVNALFLTTNTLNHQNVVIKRELLLQAGGYREDFKVASDWAFYLMAYLQCDASFKKLPFSLSVYENFGFSSSQKGQEINRVEREKAINDIFGKSAILIQELFTYRDSVYGNILNLFGSSPVLIFCLKAYRFIVRRLVKINKARSMFKEPL